MSAVGGGGGGGGGSGGSGGGGGGGDRGCSVVLKYEGHKSLLRGDGDAWMSKSVKKVRLRGSHIDKALAQNAALKHQLAEVQRRAAEQEVALRRLEHEAQAHRSQIRGDSFGTHAVSSLDLGGTTRAAPGTGAELLLRSVTEQAARKRMRPIDAVRMRSLQRSEEELSTSKERLEEELKCKARMLEKQTEKNDKTRAKERDKAAQMRAALSLHQRDAQARLLFDKLPSIAHLPFGHY